ncbi:hypothetical protein Pfo_028003 [Paulownia fortunei]|nr:hypothetical protein Pfo_028003 [Paulownia fortunei]
MEFQFLLPLTQYFFLFFFFFLLVKECRKSRNRQKLPPGPWRLPVLGNLHLLIGSLPHHALKTLAQKHGPVMYMKLGELPTLVVSSPKIAKEITKTNDVAFADRVELMIAKIYWRQMRKLCVLEFLSHKKVRSFHTLMEDEVLRLVDSVRISEGLPINLTKEILSVECGIICRATVGRVCKDQESLIMIIKEAVSIAGVFNFADVFPSMKFLHFLSAGSRRRLEKMHERIDCILKDIIRQHEEKRVPAGNGRNASDESMEQEDLLDVFLRLSENKDLQVPITRDNIKANIFEMFIAGIETSSLVIEWAMSEMVKNPRVMRKAQAEVRQALQGKQRFLGSDIQTLSYLKMVIKETLRLHPPGPLLCPRRCREQTKIGGYDIPVTIVMINVWAIGRDPEYWWEPERFEPERFQDVATDCNGNHFEFIPFGAGRRICPGIAFGLAGVELSLAHLLYHYDWKIPGGIDPEEFDMTENFGASGGRKNNLCLIAKCDLVDGSGSNENHQGSVDS